MKEPTATHPINGPIPFSQCPSFILQAVINRVLEPYLKPGDLPDSCEIDRYIAAAMLAAR